MSVEDAVRPPRRGAGDDDSDEPATMAPVLDDVADAAELEAEPEKRRDLTMVRRIAIVAWVAFMAYEFSVYGLAFDRTRLIVLLCLCLLYTSDAADE